MSSCSEFVLDDLMAVTAIPLSNYSQTEYLLSPTIPSSRFSPDIDSDVIVVGKNKAANSYGMELGSLIPIIHSSGKVKDTENTAVSGRSHSVSVECEVDDRDSETWDLLHKLEMLCYHLILTLRDGTRTIVYATKDTYQCSFQRGDGKTSVLFKVHNMMGMQLIV